MEFTKKPIKLRDGSEIPKGCPVSWREGKATVHGPDREYRVSARGAARALEIPEPDDETLGHWVCDSVCESVLGETVEPDGYDSEGSPSWLLALGMI